MIELIDVIRTRAGQQGMMILGYPNVGAEVFSSSSTHVRPGVVRLERHERSRLTSLDELFPHDVGKVQPGLRKRERHVVDLDGQGGSQRSGSDLACRFP